MNINEEIAIPIKIANGLVLLIDIASILIQLDLFYVHHYNKHLFTFVFEKKIIA